MYEFTFIILLFIYSLNETTTVNFHNPFIFAMRFTIYNSFIRQIIEDDTNLRGLYLFKVQQWKTQHYPNKYNYKYK